MQKGLHSGLPSGSFLHVGSYEISAFIKFLLGESCSNAAKTGSFIRAKKHSEGNPIYSKGLDCSLSLVLGNVADIFFAEEKSRAFGRKADAEAIAIVVADVSAQLFAVFQHNSNLGAGVNK